jgi:methionine sulfoxide reductase heme-binding subunit
VLNKILISKWTKVVVFLTCLIPLGLIIWGILNHDFDANPPQLIEHATGDWTIRFLVFTLTVTPLRKLLHVPQLIRFRRMIGLFAFFYVCLHFTTYIWLDKFFSWPSIWDDLHKRTYIILGFTGFVLLIPLAITSTAGWIRRLGGKRWQMLHRLIYAAAVAGVIHYYWLVKSDVRKPLLYAFLVGILLAWRLGAWILDRNQRRVSGAIRPKAPTTAETV